ncbi:MAG TPA: hypothetical protein VKP67_21375 [Xanthobacteraceae bacterium]|nr:hypothetical protein [Xanthobacteraceae bacterium]
MTVASAGAVPVPGNGDTALPALRRCLKAARARSRVKWMLQGAAFSLVAALVVLCGLEVLGIYRDAAATVTSLAELPEYFVSDLALSGAVFMCTLALASIVVFLCTPDIATFARTADRALALQERLSTALEVDARLQPPALGPVQAALLADAERHAASIDPRQIVRLDLPRVAWALPILMAAAVLLRLVSPDAFGLSVSRGPTAAERDAVGFTSQQAAVAAANLRRIAELLDKDAAQRSDPYLRTIARAVERLASEVADPGVDRRVLTNALDRFLAHTRQAYGQMISATDRGLVQRDVLQQFQATLDEIAGARQAGAPAPSNPDGGGGDIAAAERGQARPPTHPSERKNTGGRTLPEKATPDRQSATWDDLLKDLDDYDPVDPRIEKERAFAEQQRRARAASQALGAAQDAGRGDGDRAGDGTRPLGNGGATTSTELTPGVEMLLPDQGANGGRRIRIELPPDVVLSGVAPPTAAERGEWRRVQEEPIERTAPGAEGRRVIGRYFLRSAEGRGP